MNYGLIVIFDEDCEYANCLADYFRIKGCLASEIVVFTKQNPFMDFIDTNPVDILIVHEDYYNLVKDKPNFTNVFVLTENPASDLDTRTHYLYKYTSADELLRQVMTDYEPIGNRAGLTFHRHLKCRIIGVASPVGRCGKTSFALSLGLKLSSGHSCLFISFDFSSPADIILKNRDTGVRNLYDLLYYFIQSPDLLESRFLSAVKSVQGLDFIPPSEQYGLLSEISTEDMAAFLSKIAAMNKYDYIIIDFGYLSSVSPLLSLCDHIFLPELKDDLYCQHKLSVFHKFIKSQEHGEAIAFHSIFVPFVTFCPDVTEYLLTLTSGELGQFTSSILTGINL